MEIASLKGLTDKLNLEIIYLNDNIMELKEQDKLKVTAIIILSAALLMIIFVVVYKMLVGKSTPSPTNDGDNMDKEVKMSDKESKTLGNGIKRAIELAKDYSTDIVERNSIEGENKEMVEGQMKCLCDLLYASMQDYVPKAGEEFNQYKMVAQNSDGEVVSEVERAGKRVGDYIVFSAKVKLN